MSTSIIEQVTIFVNWAVGFDTERRRSDEYYYDPYSGYYCKSEEHLLKSELTKTLMFVPRQANQPTAGRQQLVRPDPGLHGLVGQHDRRVGQRHRPQAHHLPDGERCQFALLV